MRFTLVAGLIGVANAAIKPFVAHENLPEGPLAHSFAANVNAANQTEGFGKLEYFDQLIDHSNPSLGTFKQRYWWNIDHYGGPNSPISLESPGESAVSTDGDLYRMTNRTMPGLLAQDNQGAYIRIEHRYFGPSTPAKVLDTESLQYMTLDNAVQDLVYFAKNVVFPFDKTGGKATKPDVAPWLLSGCSYSGALSAWVHALSPGTFWAHEAGSAVVEAREKFSDYLLPIQASMTKNCTADFKLIIKHTDKVLMKGTEAQKLELKTKFAVANYTDKHFAKYISDWVSIAQGQQVYATTSQLDAVCDYMENQLPTSTVPKPGAEGVGLELALDGLARGYEWMNKNGIFPADDVEKEVNPWYWFLCNEPFEWWQSYDRFDKTGFFSRVYDWKDDIRLTCDGQFPDKNGHQYALKTGRTYHTVNKHTGGWRNVKTTRLLWINGEFDPWRPATVSWEGRPGGALQSTPEAPVHVIKGAYHCNDYYFANADTPQGKPVFDATRATFRQWVGDFYKQHPHLQ